MNDQMTADREAVLAAVAAHVTPEEAQAAAEAEERAQLERRRQEVAPEALAGDEDARAELERVNGELAALDERQTLRSLAEAETAERARVAAEQEAERQREAWAREKADTEAALEVQLGKVEQAISTLVDAIPEAQRLSADIETLGKKLDPGYARRPLRYQIENRLSWRLREVGIRDLPPLFAAEGMEPLASPAGATCSVCARGDRQAIDEALAAGDSLSAVSERHGIARSTLGRHRQHASG